VLATIIVKGRVQGVGYREFVRQSASMLMIKGSVRNLGNGTVEVFVDGPNGSVAGLVSLLKKERPSAAWIEDVAMYIEGDDLYRGAWQAYGNGFSIDSRTGD
jgi:acylphosphatase